MKVRDLVKATLSRGNSAHGAVEPMLSVILVVSSFPDSGSLLPAIGALVSRPLPSVEVIVVDDAGEEGASERIPVLAGKECLPIWLAHPHAVRLPAVSFYEGFVRAQGRYVLFAADDFVFDPCGLQELLDAALRENRAAVHGYVESFDADGRMTYLGKDETAYEAFLKRGLTVSSLLLARSIIEDVGLFDPHVAAVDSFEWDFVARVLRKHSISRVPVLVGRDYGRIGGGARGRLPAAASGFGGEYFRRLRGDALKASRIGEFDVWQIPPGSSPVLAQTVISRRKRFKGVAWAAEEAGPSPEEFEQMLNPTVATIGLYGDPDASMSLFFDAMPEENGLRYVFLGRDLSEAELRRNLAGCDAVILAGNLLDENSLRVISICEAMKIRLCCFVDEDFVVVSDEQPHLTEYTRDDVTRALRPFHSVLCGSSTLAGFLKENAIHASVEQISLACDDRQIERSLASVRPSGRRDSLRLGFSGDSCRIENLLTGVIPALRQISPDTPIELFSGASIPDPGAGIGLKQVGFAGEFDNFLDTWQSFDLDILLHPRGKAVTVPYKSAGILLVALYVRAVPIVCDEPAFRDFDETDGVLKIDGTVQGWKSAIDIARDEAFRRLMLERLERRCREMFSPARNFEMFRKIVTQSGRSNVLTWCERMRSMMNMEVMLHVPLSRMEAELNSRSVRIVLALRRRLDSFRNMVRSMNPKLTHREGREVRSAGRE